MQECCELAVNPHKEGRVIHETNNFFVCAGLGSMGIPGYVLIVSREHFDGTGDIPEEHHPELQELIKQTKSVLSQTYHSRPILFEHGPRVGMCGWGGCIDHAHLHLIPTLDITDNLAVRLMRKLDQDKFYRVDRVDGLKRTMEIFGQGRTSYLLYEDQQDNRFVAEINFPGPSQWLRKITATKIGSPEWNWRLHPYREMAMQTAETLYGKFS